MILYVKVNFKGNSECTEELIPVGHIHEKWHFEGIKTLRKVIGRFLLALRMALPCSRKIIYFIVTSWGNSSYCSLVQYKSSIDKRQCICLMEDVDSLLITAGVSSIAPAVVIWQRLYAKQKKINDVPALFAKYFVFYSSFKMQHSSTLYLNQRNYIII